MSPPRTALYGAPRPVESPAAAEGPGRRAVLVQCDQCSVKGTGWIRRGRLATVNLAATFRSRQWRHNDCGGLLVAFDIAEDA